MVRKSRALEFWFWRYDVKLNFTKIFEPIRGRVRLFLSWTLSMFVFLNQRTSFSNVKYHKELNGKKIEGPGVGLGLWLGLGLGLVLGTYPVLAFVSFCKGPSPCSYF